MQAIGDAISKDDLNKLLAQGRFLEHRFGTNDALSIAPRSGADTSTRD
jgi:hypothetical protein